jgi:hypothetical protein
MSNGSEPCLPAREGSGTAMRTMALNPTPGWEGLRRCRVANSSGPCLPAGRALALPRFLWFPVGRGPQA